MPLVQDASATPVSGSYSERVILSSGTYTPPFDCKALVYVIGGGGSGGSAVSTTTAQDTVAASGGGAGGIAVSELTLSAAVSYTATIGAGGAAAANSPGTARTTAGNAGGQSVFSGSDITTMTANGGSGGVGDYQTGSTQASATGGAGGTASGGSLFNATGGAGGPQPIARTLLVGALLPGAARLACSGLVMMAVTLPAPSGKWPLAAAVLAERVVMLLARRTLPALMAVALQALGLTKTVRSIHLIPELAALPPSKEYLILI
jgi:hypothetical protein